jgi:hypothetical protein
VTQQADTESTEVPGVVFTSTLIGRKVASGRVERGGADEGVNVHDLERLPSLAGGGAAGNDWHSGPIGLTIPENP